MLEDKCKSFAQNIKKYRESKGYYVIETKLVERESLKKENINSMQPIA